MSKDGMGAKLLVVLGGGAVAVGLLTARAHWSHPKPAPVTGTATVTHATPEPKASAVVSAAPEEPKKAGPTQGDRVAFLEAIDAGDLAKVKALREKGVSIHGTLAHAAKAGNADVLSFLLEQGLDIHEDEDAKVPPILEADEHASIVSLMLAKGAKEPSLVKAAGAGAPKTVARLLAKGASANEKTSEGEPALHVAIQNNGGAVRRAIVDQLLEKGADVNAKYDDETALGIALPAISVAADKPENGGAALVAKLVSKGAKIEGSSLTWVLDNVQGDAKAAALDTLLGGKLSKDATAIAVDRAAEQHDVDAIKKLAAKGIQWSALESQTSPPLAEAIVASDVPIVKALLAAGAPTEKVFADGDHALLAAVTAASGDSDDAIKVVKALLDAGMNPNKRGKEGTTPLYLATQQGSEVLVALLVSRGARVDEAVDGLSPLDVAEMRGHDGIAKYLKNHGAHHKKPAAND
ncbi:MAG: ankyrin repeat domain-containing protein [Deltaproteobacteria bacterium]|nr:ankyrin repeat domain-containing protein [Deltaproteobacteria bacterium]